MIARLLILLLWGLLPQRPVLACSSCGSGGADPLILNPSEQQKVYVGLGLQTGFRDFDYRGEERRSYGPERKMILELAFAQRLTSKLFASAVVGAGFNRYGDRQASGLADSSLNLRYTALQPSMLENQMPQLQFLLSHRFASGASVHEAKKPHYLDVFGSGYDETNAGFDLWWGMLPVVGGVSYIYGIPHPHAMSQGKMQMGHAQRGILSLGFMPLPELKLLGGFVSERRGLTKLDGDSQADSDRRSNDGFFTAETLRPEGDNGRLIIGRRAAWGDLKNASRAWTVTLAWMRAL